VDVSDDGQRRRRKRNTPDYDPTGEFMKEEALIVYLPVTKTLKRAITFAEFVKIPRVYTHTKGKESFEGSSCSLETVNAGLGGGDCGDDDGLGQINRRKFFLRRKKRRKRSKSAQNRPGAKSTIPALQMPFITISTITPPKTTT
jgi:hypothetical protein